MGIGWHPLRLHFQFVQHQRLPIHHATVVVVVVDDVVGGVVGVVAGPPVVPDVVVGGGVRSDGAVEAVAVAVDDGCVVVVGGGGVAAGAKERVELEEGHRNIDSAVGGHTGGGVVVGERDAAATAAGADVCFGAGVVDGADAARHVVVVLAHM